MRNLVTEAVAEDRKIPNPEQQLADVTFKLRNQFLRPPDCRADTKGRQPEISEAEKIELLRAQEKLRQQKRTKMFALGEV
jgi:hypothetical protein